MSAYNNGVFATLWRQGPRSRRTGPKNRNRAQKQLIWLSKKIPLGPAQIHAGPKKISPQGPENTQASPHIFCDPRSKKNPPACRRVLWILLVRSCTVCLVFCLCLDFPLARIFAPSNLNPPPPPLPQFQPKPRLRSTIFSVFSSYFVSFVSMCWVRLCPRLAHRARVLVCSTAS